MWLVYCWRAGRRGKRGPAIVNLQALWDRLILGTGKFQDVRDVATRLRQQPEFARDRLSKLSGKRFEQRAKVESFAIAKREMYLNGKPLFAWRLTSGE